MHPLAMTSATLAYRSIPQRQTGATVSRLGFRILGALEVSRNGSGPIPLGGTKQRAVLAHLLFRAKHRVPTEVLIDEIWLPPTRELQGSPVRLHACRPEAGHRTHDRPFPAGPGERTVRGCSSASSARSR